jgi:hypothetical protein
LTAGTWPGREAAGGDDAPFARQLGDVRKVVVSRQRLEFSWRNSELIKGDRLEAVEAFPTGVIRVIYSPAEAPAKAGYDEIKDKAPGGN